MMVFCCWCSIKAIRNSYPQQLQQQPQLSATSAATASSAATAASSVTSLTFSFSVVTAFAASSASAPASASSASNTAATTATGYLLEILRTAVAYSIMEVLLYQMRTRTHIHLPHLPHMISYKVSMSKIMKNGVQWWSRNKIMKQRCSIRAIYSIIIL